MEDASREFLNVARKSIRKVRSAIGITAIKPDLLTAAKRNQYEGYLCREEANAAVLACRMTAGRSNKSSAEPVTAGNSFAKSLAARERRSPHPEKLFRSISSLARRSIGQRSRSAAALWRNIKSEVFQGSLPVVSERATRRRRTEKAELRHLDRTPPARTNARLMTTGQEHLSKTETLTIDSDVRAPALVEAHGMIADFQSMIRNRNAYGLPWMRRASESLVVSFCSGMKKDEAAPLGANVSPWSNGHTEGQITKLKLVKCQMYGGGKIDLLQARLIGAT